MKLVDGVNIDLQNYVIEEIFPLYNMNGESHGIGHIIKVIERTFEIVKELEESDNEEPKFDYNMLYVIAAYHDIGDHIDRKKHNIISGKIMFEDKKLDTFFNLEEKKIMKEAIEDHRASNKQIPRSMYGRIILTADRNNCLNDFFKRRVQYCLEHHPEYCLEEVQDEIWHSSKKKFGKGGYAQDKLGYVPSRKLKKYFKMLEELLNNKESFYANIEKFFNEISLKCETEELNLGMLDEIKINEDNLQELK